MENTATFGRVIGWISIVAGVVVIALGLLAGGPGDAVAEYERCERSYRLGIRQAPCPPPAPPLDRPLMIGAGLGAVSSGVFFLLLSGILATLLGMREDAQRADRERQAAAQRIAMGMDRGQPDAPTAPGQAPQRYIHPNHAPPAPRRESLVDRIGDPPANPIPSRFEMLTRHGEKVGGAAWDIMREAQKKGFAIPEGDAVAEALRRG